MFKNKFLLLTIISMLTISCSDDETDNLPPRGFSAAAVQSGFNSITFRWTESTDPENSIVKYDVYIAENIDGAEYELIAENLSEQLVADTDIININGENISISPPENPEFRFAYIATNLTHNTDYKGKIIAFDQEGNKTETYFYSSTLTDIIAPSISGFQLQEVYRYNSKIYFTITDNIDSQYDWKIYLNDQLHDSVSSEQINGGNNIIINYYIENIDENTFYSAKIISIDSNGNESEPLEFSFTTTGDSYIGDLNFYQNTTEDEITLFNINQYTSINGNIRLEWFTINSSFGPTIASIEGELSLKNFNTGVNSYLFPNLITLNGNLVLDGQSLQENHLPNLISIEGDLNTIGGLSGNNCLNNLVTVNGDFYGRVGNLSGFENFENISGKLQILDSPLNNINFLNNVQEIAIVILEFNFNLIDFCGLENAANNNGIGSFSTAENGYNPTLNDIINGNCSQ